MSAAAGAAAVAQSQRDEEEQMTPYASEELAENWEFKILRSATSAFRDPAWLRQVLQEEARAKWTLVEKFDDQRLRLKRPVSARSGDASLGFDAYRTWVGVGPGRFAIALVAGIVGGVAVILAVVFFLVFLFAGHHG